MINPAYCSLLLVITTRSHSFLLRWFYTVFVTAKARVMNVERIKKKHIPELFGISYVATMNHETHTEAREKSDKSSRLEYNNWWSCITPLRPPGDSLTNTLRVYMNTRWSVCRTARSHGPNSQVICFPYIYTHWNKTNSEVSWLNHIPDTLTFSTVIRRRGV